MITMADGSKKPIEKIVQGDRVLSYQSGKPVSAVVEKVHEPFVAPFYFVVNGEVRMTTNHPVLIGSKTWVSAGALQVGDTMTSPDGLDVPVASLERVDEEAMVFNFQVEGGTYVADDIVVHNKEDCEEYMQYCPECEGMD